MMSKRKRLLKGIKPFEISYTEASQGGACSGINDPILLKSQIEEKSLSGNQKQLLDKYGKDYSGMSKSKESASDESPKGSQHNADNKTNETEKETEDTMSEEMTKALQDEIKELKKALDVEKAEKSLAGFELEADLKKELAVAIVDSGSEAIVKSLEALEAAKVEAVEKAKEVVEKSATEEENPVAKALSVEAGEAGETEVVLTKSQKVQAKLEAKGDK
jgi:hypothetical protein